MSSVRNKMKAIHKEELKKEEEINNGNGTIINEYADRKIDIEAIAKQADKDADKLLKKTAVEVNAKKEEPKVKVKSEPKAKAKPVANKKVKPVAVKKKK